MLTRIVALVVLSSVANFGAANTYTLETVAEGLAIPWGLAFLPDGGYLVTEHHGDLRHVSKEGTVSEPIEGVPSVYHAGQGGLFDVVLHPDFVSNQLIYLTYAGGTPDDNGTAITRARLDLARGRLEGPEEIFRVSRRKDTTAHYGGRLAFLPDGTMLLTTGDGFSYRHEAQDLTSQLGKTLRMNDDGTPADGNPFPGSPYVFTYGHRNPQGLAVTADGRIFLSEHGPQGGDEINLIKSGKNYGWPAICYCLDYSGAYVTPFTEWDGMEQPLHYWTPSIAPSGLTVYEGDQFPDWHGHMLNGALVDAEVRGVAPGSGNTDYALFSEVGERVRDVRTGPDGAVYFTVEGSNGRIIRAVPTE